MDDGSLPPRGMDATDMTGPFRAFVTAYFDAMQLP
jgi:hypothetical protein